MVSSELSLLGVALFGSLAYGGGDFIGGRASLKLSPVGVIALAQIAALVLAATAVPWSGWSLLTGPTAVELLSSTFVPGLIGGVFYALALASLYRGIAEGRAALVTPVFGIVSVIVPLGADALLERALSQTQVGGLMMCGIAIVLLAQVREATTGHGPHFSFRLGVIGGMADGVADVCLGAQPLTQALDALLVARATMAALALALLISAALRYRAQPAPVKRPSPFALVLAATLAIGAGLCDAMGHYSYVLLATQGSISVASALVGVLSSAVVVLLAVALLRERLAPTQLSGFVAGAVGIFALAG